MSTTTRPPDQPIPGPRPRMVRITHLDTELAAELREAEEGRALALEAAERKRQGRAPEPRQPRDTDPHREEAISGAPPGGSPPPAPPTGQQRRTGDGDGSVTLRLTESEHQLVSEMLATHPWTLAARRAGKTQTEEKR